jgi:hypothetical protein
MRTGRTVGLSQDGTSLIVATDNGDELAIPVDDQLRAALRGDRPRLGQLEIEMENTLGPRDIQSRIRSGQSLEDVGRVAGIPLDRVERFAAPVLAERAHIATIAMSSSVRRRGETSGHRNLRLALSEKLLKRGVDIDTIAWDSFRTEDGRWSVSADYLSGETTRKAVFLFDLQGRFSVAANDEARWVLGEQSTLKGPQPGRRRPNTSESGSEADTEPTLDLSDELALVRVVQPPDESELHVVPDSRPAEAEADEVEADDDEVEVEAHDEVEADDEVEVEVEADFDQPAPDGGELTDRDEAAGSADAPGPGDGADQEPTRPVRGLYPVPDQVRSGDRFGQQPAYEEIPPSEGGFESPLETLSGMLDRGSQRVRPGHDRTHGGLSDASAVPDTDLRGWEPGIVVDYPVEPSTEEELSDQGPHGTDTPAADEPPVEGDDRAEEAVALEGEAAAPAPEDADPAPKPPAKRKRAAVPSWDEIMFGGPKRSG